MTVGGVPFSCGTNTSLWLCGHPDAICAENVLNQEYCICPPGYTWDYTGPHAPNCTMPTWFLAAVLGVSTIGSFAALSCAIFPLFKQVRSGTRLQKVLVLYSATLFLLWAHTLAVYLQNGNFEVAFGLFILTPFIIIAAGYHALMLLVEPLYRAVGLSVDNFSKFLRVFYGIPSALLFCLQLASFAYISDPQAIGLYNVLYAAQLLIISLLYPATTIMLYIKTRDMHNAIISLTGPRLDEKMQKFLIQLKALRTMAITLSFYAAIMIVPVFILIFGSCPYQYIVWALSGSGLWMNSWLLNRFARARDLQSSNVQKQSVLTSPPQQQSDSLK